MSVRHPLLSLIATVSFILGAVEMVTAQVYQTFAAERSSIISNSKFTLGPLYVIPGIRFGFGYDSNIYRVNSDRGPIEDYSVGLSLPVDVHMLGGNWLIVSLGYTPSYDYYFQVGSERAFNHALSLGARLLFFNRIPVSGGYTYSRNKYRISTEFDRRVFQEAIGYHGGINIDTPGNSSMGISFSTREMRYEDISLPGSQVPVSQALDRTENDISASFYLPVFTDSQFFASLSRTNYAFTEPGGTFRDSVSYQSYLGIRFPILGRARGNLAIGYKKFLPREEGQPGFSGIVANTDAEVRLGRINLRALYVRDLAFSYGAQIFYIHSSYGAGLSFYVSQILRIDYDYHYGLGDYPTEEGLASRKDTYKSHSIGIVFRVLRRTGIGLTADIMERDSNQASLNMNQTLFGAYLTYDF